MVRPRPRPRPRRRLLLRPTHHGHVRPPLRPPAPRVLLQRLPRLPIVRVPPIHCPPPRQVHGQRIEERRRIDELPGDGARALPVNDAQQGKRRGDDDVAVPKVGVADREGPWGGEEGTTMGASLVLRSVVSSSSSSSETGQPARKGVNTLKNLVDDLGGRRAVFSEIALGDGRVDVFCPRVEEGGCGVEGTADAWEGPYGEAAVGGADNGADLGEAC